MFVCASTECFPDLEPQGRRPGDSSIDLEYTAVELDPARDRAGRLAPKPSEVARRTRPGDLHLCRARPMRMDRRRAVASRSPPTGDAYFQQFESICKLAKAIKVVSLVVPSSSELGTPFNEEIERLQEDGRPWPSLEGAVGVAARPRSGCMTAGCSTLRWCSASNVPGPAA